MPGQLFHLHIPKSGGTALSEFLAQFYEESAVFPSLYPFDVLERAAESAQANAELGLSDTRLFTRAHFTLSQFVTYEQARLAGQRLKTVCFFRNPTHRSVSLVQHLKRTRIAEVHRASLEGRANAEVRDKSLQSVEVAQSHSIAETLQWMTRQTFEGDGTYSVYVPQIRYLSPLIAGPKADESMLENALYQLGGIDMIGIVEDNLASLQKICWLLDLPMPEVDHEANVAPERAKVDQAIVEASQELTRLDWQLYGHALRRHYQELAYMPKPGTHNRQWAFRQRVPRTKSTFNLTMEQALMGWGWHVREGGGPIPFSRWTTHRSVFYAPLCKADSYELGLHVGGVLNERNLHQSHIEVNGYPIPLKADRPEAPLVLRARIPGQALSPYGATRIDIVPHAVDSHEAIAPGCGDRRLKGLAIHQITID